MLVDRTPSTTAVRRELPALQLDRLSVAADATAGVRRGDLEPGDRLVVATKNSVYVLQRLPDGRFLVSGGCFARAEQGARVLEVSGCTAGGRALFTSLIAAPGFFLELGDGTQTTRIRTVRRIPANPRLSLGSDRLVPS